MIKEQEHPSKKPQKWLVTLIGSGFVVLLSLIMTILGTVVGMMRAFRQLSTESQPDPADLASNISFAMMTTMWGSVISLVALFVMIIAGVMCFITRKRD